MLSDERLLKIGKTARRYDTAHSWTGAGATLAGMIVELLKEVARLKAELTASHRRELYWREKDCAE